MLLITLFLNVLDIETKETDLETWQGNSFKFCNSQKDFITFFLFSYKNVFQYWKVWIHLSGKDKIIVFTVTLLEVFVTRSAQFCQFYICQFCQPSPTPFAASTQSFLLFLSGHFGSQLFITDISWPYGGNQNPKPKYICLREWGWHSKWLPVTLWLLGHHPHSQGGGRSKDG